MLPRGSFGWHAQPPLWAESRSDTCRCPPILVLDLFLICSSHCVGSTADKDGRDFESFVGAEKAQEIKTLFSSWIHAVYRELFLAGR